MIHKAIEIVKARWPEVALVVVLQAALMLFSDELVLMAEATETSNAQLPFWPSFLLGVGTMVTATIWQMLYLGFMKTSAIEGTHPQQPLDLLRLGRPYFWKIMFFQLMFVFFLMLLSMIMAVTLGGIIWKTDDITKIPEWFSQVCAMAAVALMIKPILLVPARIVVYDNSVAEAFMAMRQYRMGQIGSLFKVLAGGLGVVLVFMLLVELATKKTALYYILSGMHHLSFSMLFLVLALMAVLRLQKNLEVQQAAVKEEQI
ncbi:MAG: hypothetical protein H8E62_03235 [Planctomycetes bacterium]|nr:hypothetical protein [Planctomycetota bacterium]